MMVPERTGWVRTVLRYRGSELPRTKNRILGVLVLSIVVTALEKSDAEQMFDVRIVPFTLIGVALSIFLGFRTTPPTSAGGRDASSGRAREHVAHLRAPGRDPDRGAEGCSARGRPRGAARSSGIWSIARSRSCTRCGTPSATRSSAKR